MTRKEEIIQQAAKLAKGAVGSRDHAKCLTYFVEGAEWADKTMIDKAVEWLSDHVNDYLINDKSDGGKDWLKCRADMFDNFRKAMEE